MRTVVQDGRSQRAERRRLARKEEILRAAQDVIGSRGYQSTSIADVIDAAGISRGTFYLYFDSREALFHEILDRFIRQLIDCIQVVHLEDGAPIEQLYQNVLRVVKALLENRTLTIILLREAVGLDAQVDKKLNALHIFMRRMLAGALRNGAKWNLTRKVNEEIIAIAIMGTIKEIFYQYLMSESSTTPDPETIAKELLTFGMQGLQPA